MVAVVMISNSLADQSHTQETPRKAGIELGIVVRTTENVTSGGWVWLLNQCEALGVHRIDLLVKQDEDNFTSERTGQTLESGELLVPLPGETCAKGWENADWLKEMMLEAKKKNIQIWAWWPCFHDSEAAKRFPNAAYTSKRGENFVDPAFPGVRERQEELLSKLLTAYPFDGVSLDWVRYEGLYAGKNGPLANHFQYQYPTFQWSDTALENNYSKARWYEVRAKLLSSWVQNINAIMRTNYPGVRWGAFLLPWQFSETSVNYHLFGKSGIDFLQPMGYWADWKFAPEWVGNELLSPHAELQSGTSFWPTLGIDVPKAEMERALASIPQGVPTGISWFTFGAWEQKTFNFLQELIEANPDLRNLMGNKPTENKPTESTFAAYANNQTQKPMQFPSGCSLWSVLCLAELYRTNSISDRAPLPVVPVLAFHTFAEGKPGTQVFSYKTTTDYLDALFAFIEKNGFHVCPLSSLQSYLITRDPYILPTRPLVITLDDGSMSVYKHFYPRAKKHNTPFAISLVTSWLRDTSETPHSTNEKGTPDPTMTWNQAREINQSGLADFVSHTDGMHYQAAEQLSTPYTYPVITTRQFLTEFNRPETNSEYERRIRLDMITSRLRFQQHGFRVPSILCWPYGEWNRSAKQIAEQTGFTHFLLYDTHPVFATAADSHLGIPRIRVMSSDESVPLEFPSDNVVAQSWWLAFLKVARDSKSAELILATLDKLTPENRSTPTAQIAIAAINYIKGDALTASTSLTKLQETYALKPEVISEIKSVFKDFNPSPLLPPAHP